MKLADRHEFTDAFLNFVPKDGRPVLVYSSLWSLSRAVSVNIREIPQLVIDTLTSHLGADQTLLMPTYTNGYTNGEIDLDAEACTTGVVSEAFRKHANTLRTASAFFSYSVWGRDAQKLADARPEHAWGPGSIFDYIEKNDAHILMIGSPWNDCSFRHRVEWNLQVPYREPKVLGGNAVIRAKRQVLTEKLFVRRVTASGEMISNFWPDCTDRYLKEGMRSLPFGVGQVAEIGAKALLRALTPLVENDSFALVKEPERFRNIFIRGK